MEKKEFYVVWYGNGDCEAYQAVDIFATFNLQTAIDYKEKFNRIVSEAKKHYLTNDGELKEKYENTFIQDIYFEYGEVDRCFISKIEIR